MKSFDEWKMDIDDKVALYDARIAQLRLELNALIAVRDSYALASYPHMAKKKYEPGMEDCGK